MTWLFPVLANLTARRRVDAPEDSNSAAQTSVTLAVLIPAHNEQAILRHTLDSINAAITAARSAFPKINVSITVGADGCSDATAQIARDCGADVLESAKSQGKWKTLQAMVATRPNADWIVFADAGILWEKDFLITLIPICCEPKTIGIAPTYRNPGGGVIEDFLWGLERHLKEIEASAGGPVSVHGATVLYRATELRAALAQLGEKNWLNDDVVLPLTLRSLFPDCRLRYVTSTGVRDHNITEAHSVPPEFGRRRRMVLGNVQWMRGLLGPAWKRNRVVGILALRRVFRLMWAYWALIGVLAVTAAVSQFISSSSMIAVVVVSLAGLTALAFRFRPVRSLIDAAHASLLSPLYIVLSPRSAEWR